MMKLSDFLQGPGLIFCTFDRALAEQYRGHLVTGTEVSLLGKTYLVTGCEWQSKFELSYPGEMFWFELREVVHQKTGDTA